jgi:hypothetical protein
MRKISFILFFIIIIIFSSYSTTVEINLSSAWGLYDEIEDKAFEYLGVPYLSGGTTKEGMDCSGLTYTVYKEAAGITLPRTVSQLILSGDEVEDGLLLPGDLVFFDTTGNGASHVGIFIGGGEFMHSASDGPRTGVTIDELTTEYYRERYLGARRYVKNMYPLIKIVIDDESGSLDIPYTLPAGIPLYFSIASELEEEMFVDLNMYKSDNPSVFSKRIRISKDEEPGLVMFIPDEGSWKAVISDGSDMVQISFKAEDQD